MNENSDTEKENYQESSRALRVHLIKSITIYFSTAKKLNFKLITYII